MFASRVFSCLFGVVLAVSLTGCTSSTSVPSTTEQGSEASQGSDTTPQGADSADNPAGSSSK